MLHARHRLSSSHAPHTCLWVVAPVVVMLCLTTVYNFAELMTTFTSYESRKSSTVNRNTGSFKPDRGSGGEIGVERRRRLQSPATGEKENSLRKQREGVRALLSKDDGSTVNRRIKHTEVNASAILGTLEESEQRQQRRRRMKTIFKTKKSRPPLSAPLPEMAPAAPQSPQQQQSPQQHQPPQQHQSPQHGLPLSSLDGVATFVMGTTGIPKQPWLNWWTRVVPTFNTWGRENRHLYVVLPHVSATLQFLRKRRCVAGPLPPRALAHKFRLKEPLEYTCPRPWTSSTAETETAILPTILVTAYSQLNCTDEYRGDGPCCKANFALWFMLTVKRHMLATPLAKGRNNDNSGNGAVAADGAGGGGIKWVAFLDDDVYVRGAGLAALLGNGLDPVYSAVAVVPAEKCFRPPYHKDDPKKRATDNFPHACRPYFNDTFWAHPAWLSVASLYKAELGILAGGVRDQCGVLGTSHEAGLGQFLWMHGVGCTPLSPNAYSARGDLKPGLVVVHRSRVKAGDLNSSLPLEDTPPALLKMHQVHDYFTLGPGKGDVWGRLGGEHNSSGSSSSSSSLVGGSHSVPPEVLRQLPPPPPLVPPPPLIGPTKWPNGYSRTPHASGHNLQRKWEKLTNAGCVASPAGVTTPPLALGSAKNRPE